MKTVHLEPLLGRVVRDPDGKKAGRILAVRAEPEGEDCVVTRVPARHGRPDGPPGHLRQRLFGFSIRRKPLCIPWDLLDLRDPKNRGFGARWRS